MYEMAYAILYAIILFDYTIFLHSWHNYSLQIVGSIIIQLD